jgi:hypothetical protein
LEVSRRHIDDAAFAIFGGVPSDRNSVIRVLNLKTHLVSTLPDSRGFFGARWSPDGRYIVAMPSDSPSLALFDFQTQNWLIVMCLW